MYREGFQKNLLKLVWGENKAARGEEIKKKPGQLGKSVVTAFSNYITPNCTVLIKIMH